jgi:hypothetical protein
METLVNMLFNLEQCPSVQAAIKANQVTSIPGDKEYILNNWDKEMIIDLLEYYDSIRNKAINNLNYNNNE